MPPPLRSRSTYTEVDFLRPYTFHGVLLTEHGSQATGDCPFCGRDGKFSVEVSSGLWRCLVCGTGTQAGGGNALVFVRCLYEQAAQAILANRRGSKGFLAGVAADRRLLSPDTAAAWGICLSSIDGTWLVPGYNPIAGLAPRLDQVYRRTHMLEKEGWVWRLLPTPGLWTEGKSHALHLPVGDFDLARSNIVVCEGPWDGMALWEVWDRTTNQDTNVVAVPGCNVWRDEWTDMCRGKVVTLMFDNDHPREFVPGRFSRAGYDGMVRIAKRLSGVASSVRWLKWGPEGYDPFKPSGYDVRDALTGE